MKISVNWIRNFNELYKTSADPMPNGIDDLVEKIGAQLGQVEEVINLGKHYEGIVVVEVVTCEKHPNADKLKLCFIDDGGVTKNVERNEQGLVQVVCGAPNVKAGLTVAWIPPGVTVPATYDKDPFVLEARELRGKVSNGMLASPKELTIGDSHEGILELSANSSQLTAKPGTPLAEVLALDDYIIDIENKMFTHRPDLFGQLGIAREIAGIYGHAYKSPDWYKVNAPVPSSNADDSLKLEIKNEVPELVPRFCILKIKDVKVGPSPVWLQSYLSRIGVKSINNIVDLTNYLTQLTAQPSHAYDFDKLRARSSEPEAQIIVRKSKQGEKLKLLGGKEITLQDGAIVIASDKQAIGLAGVMGGADTEVDENTKNVVLEVGTFDMNTVRRASMTYGLFTDASTRFTKGQSPLQNRAVIAKLAEDILKLAGGRVSGDLVDDNHADSDLKTVKVTNDFINVRLGLSLDADEIKKILENVEFEVQINEEKHTTTQNYRLQGRSLQITAPFWRTDIEIPEDIVEEVGRLYGYDKLPQELPKRDLTPAAKDPLLSFKSRLREILSKTGANEVLTYSFVHGNLLDRVGQDKAQAYKISNALSPDLQYYRLSLTPSLLDKVHPNIKAGFDEFAIYEINKTHSKELMDSQEPNIPHEFQNIALVFAANTKEAKKYQGAAYYQARNYLMALLSDLGVSTEAVFRPLELERYADGKQAVVQYEPSRSVSLHIGKVNIGAIGEYKSSVRNALKLPDFSAGFELDVTALMHAAVSHAKYKPLNRFPSLEQDLTLRSDSKTTFAEFDDFINGQLDAAATEHGYIYELTPLDVFQKEDDKTHKQTTWRIILAHPERTLTTTETNTLLDEITKTVSKELGAERI